MGDGVTEVLRRMRAGEPAAQEELFKLTYDELRRLASGLMGGQRAGHTLQTTALIHEAYLKLFGGGQVDWNDRAHFLGTAARAMRHVLVDYARARGAEKRGGGLLRTALEGSAGATLDASETVVEVHEALERLEAADPRAARVVELRYFGGLGFEEIAAAMSLSLGTVHGAWEHARVRLYRIVAG